MKAGRRGGDRKTSLGNLLTLMPYFFGEQVFDRTNTDRICGPCDMDWHEYADILLEFACRKNFMRQTGETVFEQACVRRESRRYPIRYHDVTSDGIRTFSGPKVNKRIYRIYDALWAWGIRKGDRIALTGINSVDYMTLEQAIGLMGAVSVPIYYTTPAEETSVLLAKSGAKWFFIGDKRMADQLAEIETNARIVLFSAGLDMKSLAGHRMGLRIRPDTAHETSYDTSRSMDHDREAERRTHPQILLWKEFLSKSGRRAPKQYPDPDDLATIRFTSGTTGEPKGVMFSYKQLAWMGETLTNLLPWKERNDQIRYLSFLPLSHVVEGILALYAPYYVLCRVDYYFLNDFGSLTDALPKVRPTVFFSVPRFYEKLWDQVITNKMGNTWMSMKDGPAGKASASLLRTFVLRKAGIDRCKQLIVGSAPISESLLKHFRDLGIEIYNAYGQTEAPLITINRIGDNVIPTVGTPLPETRVSREADGELIVTGPQVTLGYYGLDSDNIKDGVLRTGDLGLIHDDGHISLYGRKKDFIVTAYGKNISISKIEERIKDIQGISEAVLIGENRPYCTALIWLEEGLSISKADPAGHGKGSKSESAGSGKGSNSESAGSGKESGIDLAGRIEELNKGLSHPEQIRRYRVISRPLSIKAGELTPNLKVKRANVEAAFAAEIEEMYH